MEQLNKMIRIGVIGCGKIAESNHLPALLNIPGVRVEWLYDKNEQRSRLLSAMYGVPAIDEAGMNAELKNIDICLLTVPYGVRKEFIYKCAEAKTALYVEKPFAVSYAEHKEYADLFPAGKIAIGFQRRYYHTTSIVETIVKQQCFGLLHKVILKQGYFQLKGGTGFMSDSKISGGGVIIESAIHTLDQVLQFTGATDVLVKEVSGVYSNGTDYDTRFTTTVSTPNNNVEVLSHVSCLKNLDNGIELHFDNATIHFQPSAVSELLVRTKDGTRLLISDIEQIQSPCYARSVNMAFILFWKDFVHSVRTSAENRTSGNSSLLTTKWIEGVYNKLKTI